MWADHLTIARCCACIAEHDLAEAAARMGAALHLLQRDLEVHPQVPIHQPVPLLHGQQWGHPVDQQLLNGFTPKVLDPAVEPPLEGVRFIGA